MTHWMRPPELARARERAHFDPVIEGARYGLPRELSLAAWERVCADAIDSAGRLDTEQAERRFHELAARIAAGGGRLRPDVGRLTRVGAEIAGTPPGAWGIPELAPRIPGRETLVATEMRRWRAYNPGLPAREDVVRPELPGANQVKRAMAALQAPPLGQALLPVQTPPPDQVPLPDQAPSRGQATPLEPSVGARMSRLFGFDFTRIAVVPESPAVTGSTKAVTKGDAVHFLPGAYRPGTLDGDWLIAHELAHVVQQQGGRGERAGSRQEIEREADRAAALAVAGHSAPIGLRAQLGAAYAFDPSEDHGLRGGTEDLHHALIEQWREAHGYPPRGLGPDGERVGPTDSEIRFGGLLDEWLRAGAPRLTTQPYGVYEIVANSTRSRRGPNVLTQAEFDRLARAWTRVNDNSGGLIINGSAADKATMIAMLAREMGRSQTFRDLIIEITEDRAHPVTINAGRDNAFALDEFGTNASDLNDLEFLDVDPPAGYGWAWTQGEDIVHWLAERRYAALHNPADFAPAHDDAMRAGGQQERYRADRGQSGRIVAQTASASPGLFEGHSVDSAGNRTIFKMDVSGAVPVPYELEYRPASPTAAAPGLSRLSHMEADVHSGAASAEPLFVRFTSATAALSTPDQSVGGTNQTFTRPMRDVVPTNGPIRVEVVRRGSGGAADVVVVTFSWTNPFSNQTTSATLGGVRYDVSLRRVRR